jgi:hypothetical protein
MRDCFGKKRLAMTAQCTHPIVIAGPNAVKVKQSHMCQKPGSDCFVARPFRASLPAMIFRCFLAPLEQGDVIGLNWEQCLEVSVIAISDTHIHCIDR